MSWVLLNEGVNLDYLQENAKVGTVLGFDQEGTVQHYRVMRIKNGKYWAKRVNLLSEKATKYFLDGLKPKDVTEVKDL